jgi:ABC-type dipeptide/oligopeptide/nickel transport system ATPase component
MRWDLLGAVAYRVIFMDGGQIIESAPPGEFFSNPQHPRAKAFLGQILRVSSNISPMSGSYSAMRICGMAHPTTSDSTRPKRIRVNRNLNIVT